MKLRLLVFVSVFLHPLAVLHADGGAVRLSERRGDYRITVFTSPTPFRAGAVDISVFIQDAATGEPVPQSQITVRLSPREHPEAAIDRCATTAAATNKLYQAALLDLPEAGLWDAAIIVEGLGKPIELHFEIEAEEPLPQVWEIAPWIAWPVGAILLFFVHQWLVQRKSERLERISKAGSPKESRPLVTLSPNQRNSN